jgi:hypothetical protein
VRGYLIGRTGGVRPPSQFFNWSAFARALKGIEMNDTNDPTLIPCIDCPSDGSKCTSCNNTGVLRQCSIKLEDEDIIIPIAIDKSEKEAQEDFDKQLMWLRNSLGLTN